MPYSFPGSPDPGDTWTISDRDFVWDGKRWIPGEFTVTGSGGGGDNGEDVYHNKGNVSGAVTIDWNNGNVQRMVRNGNITSWTFQNWPASGTAFKGELVLIKDNNTTQRTITWPAAWEWPNAELPFLADDIANAEARVLVMTEDGGSTVRAALAGNWLP